MIVWLNTSVVQKQLVFGFGLGLERLLLVLDKQGIELPVEEVWMFTLQYLVQVPMAKLLS